MWLASPVGTFQKVSLLSTYPWCCGLDPNKISTKHFTASAFYHR